MAPKSSSKPAKTLRLARSATLLSVRLHRVVYYGLPGRLVMSGSVKLLCLLQVECLTWFNAQQALLQLLGENKTVADVCYFSKARTEACVLSVSVKKAQVSLTDPGLEIGLFGTI